MSGPLSGIKVIEWGGWIVGPVAASMLGDLGAEVIKLESYQRGDPLRGAVTLWGTQALGLGGGKSVFFEAFNRNKRSIAINLTKPEGAEIVHKLVEKSDVFLTNFREKAAKAIGIDYETLSRHNPRLIYTESSGLGTRGPDAEVRSFDTIIQARSGLMWVAGDRNLAEPVLIGGVADQAGAIMLAYATLAAIVGRERSGKGQRVETSSLASALQLEGAPFDIFLARGAPQARHSRTGAGNPLANHYRCGDGKWLVIGEPQSDQYWAPFCRAIGQEQLIQDPRFRDVSVRRRNCVELISLLDKVFATGSRAEWLEALKNKGEGIAHGPIQEIPDLVSDAQVVANEYVMTYDHPVLGQMKRLSCPAKFSRTPADAKQPAPEFGQHTEEVLLDLLGYTWQDISRLKEEEVI